MSGWTTIRNLLFKRSIWVLFLSFAGNAGADMDIWAPRQHFPAFVEPGGRFSVEVRAPASLDTAGWKASIKNELRAWDCVVQSANYGSIHQGREKGWRLSVSVPTNAPPELFELVLAHASGESARAIRAVKVVQNFETNFYILQLSDQHIAGKKAVKGNGASSPVWLTGSTESMSWAKPVIELINPRFLLITGDNEHLYFGATNWCGLPEARRRVHLYLDALKEYSVPTVIVDGNHDIGYSNYIDNEQWRATYEADMGQRVYSFRMGSFYVLCNEYSSDEYLPWARSDYAASWGDPAIKYRLIAQHFPNEKVRVAGAANPCDLMLVGHNHITTTLSTKPYPILSTGTAQAYQRSGYFSFERNAAGWNCPQVTTHSEGRNVFPLFGNWGAAPKVSATFDKTNNGTQGSNAVFIVNNLPQDFYHGRVKFLMPHGTYRTTGGSIEAQYDYGTNTAVLVQVDIRKNSTTPVSIDPLLFAK